MSKETIGKNIQTLTIPFIAMVGGEQEHPGSKMAKKTDEHFKANFTNAADFEMHEILNDRWVVIEDEWSNIGNQIIYKRLAPESLEARE